VQPLLQWKSNKCYIYYNGDRLRHKKRTRDEHFGKLLHYSGNEAEQSNQRQSTVRPNAIFDVIIQNDPRKGIPTSRNSVLQ
jgi:hypothetical protein